MRELFAETALLPDGWAENVLLRISDTGDFTKVEPGHPEEAFPGVEHLSGVVLPGVPNLHSHAFQRAMAGLAERGSDRDDTFWSWREVMYDFLSRLGPDELEAVAAQLYVEMLEAGYTAVGEFHYLHHDREGRRYGEPAEMSLRIARAAGAAGIGLTHMPVLYRSGGFGGAPPAEGQERFVMEVDELLRVVESMRTSLAGDPDRRVGLALHSLRAVPPGDMARALEAVAGLLPSPPIHVHVAEQAREVEACVEWSGSRPVAWLLDHAPVDGRWCLVHATHMDADETSALARSGAVAGLCPTTEANLGDGRFSLRRYLDRGGMLGVGSDSHVSVSPVEELRWLEYGQRLSRRARNVAAGDGGRSTGRVLFEAAVAGGSRALGRRAGALEVGRRADLVVLESDHPLLAGRSRDTLLDSWIFSGNVPLVRDVMVGGRWVVREGRHPAREEIAARYLEMVEGLTRW